MTPDQIKADAIEAAAEAWWGAGWSEADGILRTAIREKVTAAITAYERAFSPACWGCPGRSLRFCTADGERP